jgi:8-oxo-dGTP pyrophosphatase MutT (NUDIX family)
MIDMRINKNFGTLLFYFLWPLVWFYAPLRVRVRVIVKVNNEILLVKNWFGPNTWQLPGGGMKIGESSIATARREMNEELGLSEQGSKLKMLSDKVYVIKQSGLLLRYQYAVITMVNMPKITFSNEITDSEWVSIDEVDVPISIRSLLKNEP